MAGYSGTPLAKKLGIKEGHEVVLLGAPEGLSAALAPVPDGVTFRTRAGGSADLVLLFTTARKDLVTRLPALQKAIFPDGAVWVAWPKKASKVPTDVTEDVIREVCLPMGLVDVKVCAIDDTWSGLRLCIRKDMRRG